MWAQATPGPARGRRASGSRTSARARCSPSPTCSTTCADGLPALVGVVRQPRQGARRRAGRVDPIVLGDGPFGGGRRLPGRLDVRPHRPRPGRRTARCPTTRARSSPASTGRSPRASARPGAADDIFADPFLDGPTRPPLRLVMLRDTSPRRASPAAHRHRHLGRRGRRRAGLARRRAGRGPVAAPRRHVALTDFAATYLALGQGFDPATSPHVAPAARGPRADTADRDARSVGCRASVRTRVTHRSSGLRCPGERSPRALRPRDHRHRLRQLARDAGLRGQAGRRHRGRHLRRHLPQRRLHPDQDVRVCRRRRRRAPATPRATASTRPCTGCGGPTSATASSAGSTRSPTAGSATASRAPARPPSSGTPASPATGALTVDLEPSGERTITADQVVVAAGAHPVVPDVVTDSGVAVPHLRHDHAHRRRCPSGCVIIGGGYIAAEMAHVFSSFGSRGHASWPGHPAAAPPRRRALEPLHRARPRAVGRAHRHRGDRRRAPGGDGVRPAPGRRLRAVDGRRRPAARRDRPPAQHRRPRRRGRRRRAARRRPGRRRRTSAARPRPASGPSATSARPTSSSTSPTPRRGRSRTTSSTRTTCARSRTTTCPPAIFSHPQIATVGLTEQECVEQGLRHVTTVQALRRHGIRLGDGGHHRASASWSPTPPPGCCWAPTSWGRSATTLIQPLVQAMAFGTTVARAGARAVLDPPRAGRGRRERAARPRASEAAG